MTFNSDFLAGLGVEITPCGSRVTCEPPPTDTDADYLLLLPPGSEVQARVSNYLNGQEFVMDGVTGCLEYEGPSNSPFVSWKRSRDTVNLIVTSDEEFARRHKAATHVCRQLNLLNKLDRIMVFQAVLYGNQVNAGLAPNDLRRIWESK